MHIVYLAYSRSAERDDDRWMVRTFLKVYMELGSYFLFLQEQIKDIIIMPALRRLHIDYAHSISIGVHKQKHTFYSKTVSIMSL
jgi:hypothetical protein